MNPSIVFIALKCAMFGVHGIVMYMSSVCAKLTLSELHPYVIKLFNI